MRGISDGWRSLSPAPWSPSAFTCEPKPGLGKGCRRTDRQSFDKPRAKNVWITLGPTVDGKPAFFEIRDDGAGCEDLALIVCLGAHVADDDDPKMSCYGIGAKDGLLYLGGFYSAVEITSVKDPKTFA